MTNLFYEIILIRPNDSPRKRGRNGFGRSYLVSAWVTTQLHNVHEVTSLIGKETTWINRGQFGCALE